MTKENFQDYINRCYTTTNDELNDNISFLEIGDEEYCSYHCSRLLDRDCSNSMYYGKCIPIINVEYCAGSEYSGSTVEKSNYKWFENWIEKNNNPSGVYTLYGDYDSYGIAISVDPKHIAERSDEINQELVDILSGLEDYPLIDEDLHSELECELENEAFDDYVRDELCEKCEELLGVEILEEIPSEKEKRSDPIWILYRKLCEETNTNMIFEIGCQSYIDMNRLTENLCIEDLDECQLHNDDPIKISYRAIEE